MTRNRTDGRRISLSAKLLLGESRRRKCLILAASVTALGPLLRRAQAGPFTWSGAGADTNWSDASNWTSTVAPPGTGGANLNYVGSVQPNSNNDIVAGTFANIIFQSGAASYLLTGNAVLLNAASSPSISDLSSNLETIDIPLTLAGGRTVYAAAGTLSIGGGLAGTSGAIFGVNPSVAGLAPANGVVVLNSAATYTRSDTTSATLVDSGTLQVGAGGSLPTTNTAGSHNGWVQLGAAANATTSEPSTAGFLILGDATTAINQSIATLRVASNAAAGSSVYGGNILTSTLTIDNLQPGTDSYSGNLGGAGTNQNNLAMVITGGNAVSFSGTNTYNGGTTIAFGTLQTASGTALPNGGSVTFGDASNDSGTLDLDAHTSTVGMISVVGSGANNQIGNGSTSTSANAGTLVYAGSATPSTFSGKIVDNFGSTTQIGTTRLTMASGTLSLTNTDTYSGGTTLNGGTIIFSPGALGSGQITLDGGTLEYATGNNSDVSTQTINFGINGGTVNTNGNNVTFSKAIGTGGTGDFTKAGAGTLTFLAPSTYTKNTTVTGGTLLVANTTGSATGTGDVILDGGNLASGAVGSVSGNVTAGFHAHTIAPGAIGGIGTLTIGGLTTSTVTTMNFDLGTGSGTVTNGDLLILSGSGTVNIGSGTVLTFGGTPVAGNDYQLIGDNSSGAIVGAIPLGNFSLPTAPAGLAYSLAVNSNFIDLDVVVSGPPNLTWNNAGADNLWNTTSSNWNSGATNTTYSDGALVTFNDNNPSNTAANYAVTLNTTVSPASVTVNNSNGNYVIGGTGSIAGTTALSKAGSGMLTLNTVNTYSGGTNVSAGTLVAGVTGALPSGAVSITGGTLQLAPSTGLATITSLAISGTGTFDINNNHVIINYGSPASDPIASIVALLNAGYNGGAWNGPGGITSSAIATNPGYGVGYADAADVGNPAGLASGTIEVKFTLLGDADLNGTVNGIDFGILAANFNKGVSRWDQGDFNYDNIVNGVDFGSLAANFNKGASSASDIAALDAFAAANGLLADVPEPASIGLIGFAGVGLMARRRHKHK